MTLDGSHSNNLLILLSSFIPENGGNILIGTRNLGAASLHAVHVLLFMVVRDWQTRGGTQPDASPSAPVKGVGTIQRAAFFHL